jgi:hypothetical protein
MKTFLKNRVLVLLIFFGLSFSANLNASYYEYAYGSGYEVVSPSEQYAVEAGIFSHGSLFGPQKRGFEDGDGGGPADPGGGGGADNPGGYNDAPVGSGVWLLLLLVAAYGVVIYRRKKNVLLEVC